MLSKGLELRYNTGAEFTRALSVAAEGTAPMRAPAMAAAQLKEAGLRSIQPLWKRSSVRVIAAGLIIIILLVFGFCAVSTWGPRQAAVLTPPTQATGQPTSSATVPSTPVDEDTSGQTAAAIEPTATPTVPSSSPTPSPTTTPTATTIPTATPTLAPLPTPGPPTVAKDSPFTNLQLAHNIAPDNQPENVGTIFAPGSQSIYLFFDYDQIEGGATWTHRWTWGDTELGVFEDVWPDNFYDSGTAWVYHTPTGGYQPGPYKVTLEIKGQIVATATFVIQAGGL